MKKLIALLLALVMVIAMVACGNTNAPAKETEAPKADDPAKETEAPKADETEAPAEEEPTVITFGLSKKDSVENYDTNAYTLMIEEACNVDLQFVFFSADSSEYATQFGLMTTNEETLPDIVGGMGSVALYNEYGAEDFFIDLSPYLLDETKTPNWHESMETALDGSYEYYIQSITSPIDGNIYNWAKFSENAANNIGHHMHINQKWLDEVGMDIPKTPDELYEVLKAFKEKHPDFAPAIGTTSYRSDLFEWIINAYIYNYVDYFWNVEDGKLYAPYNTDEYREGLIFCKKLMDEGLVDELTLTSKDPAELYPYVSPAGQETANVGVFSSHIQLAGEENHPGVLEFTHMLTLDSGNGKGGNLVYRAHAIEVGCGITSDCENVEKAIEVLDFMCSKEMVITAQNGIRGVHWDWAEGGKANTGFDAVFVQHENIWQTQNNYIWNWSPNTPGTLKIVARQFEADGSWISQRSDILMKRYPEALEAKMPEEVVKVLFYNAEENEVVSEIATILQDFVRSQKMLFISGQIDPANDADWETYCKELEAQGLNEWREAAQSAYDRMNGK